MNKIQKTALTWWLSCLNKSLQLACLVFCTPGCSSAALLSSFCSQWKTTLNVLRRNILVLIEERCLLTVIVPSIAPAPFTWAAAFIIDVCSVKTPLISSFFIFQRCGIVTGPRFLASQSKLTSECESSVQLFLGEKNFFSGFFAVTFAHVTVCCSHLAVFNNSILCQYLVLLALMKVVVIQMMTAFLIKVDIFTSAKSRSNI